MTKVIEKIAALLPQGEASACVPPDYWQECELTYNAAQGYWYYELYNCHYTCTGSAVCNDAYSRC